MKNIGIVCEGPTDYIVLRDIIDTITGENHYYMQLQPEPDLTGKHGNGWKGVWRWCHEHADDKKRYMKEIEPILDLLVIQMDGDVSRKEREVHCGCEMAQCQRRKKCFPLDCENEKDFSEFCPIEMPCGKHEKSVKGYIDHLEIIIQEQLKDLDDVCIAIPCDSTEAWIVAACDQKQESEKIENPWENYIARGKQYHGIRIKGTKKRQKVFQELSKQVCTQWEMVTTLCISAKRFEDQILKFFLIKNKKRQIHR